MNCQKDKFNLSEDTTYLNGAYMSPILKAVEKIGIEGIVKKRNPANILPTDFFNDTEKLRIAYAKLINVSDPSRIVVSSSASYGIANATNNIVLEKDENVVVLGEQFPSNYYPWKKLCDQYTSTLKTIEPPKELTNRGRNWNEKILEGIDSNTKVVAMGHVHWADGTLFDLMAIRKKTKEVGALLIIDGTQSVGALPFDVEKIQPDALICAGYKWLLGPYSIGLSYYGEYFDNGTPIEENWINRLSSEDFAGLVAYEDKYQNGALRYETGEHSNFILVPMLLKSIEQLNHWGVDNIQQYCKNLIQPILQDLKNAHIEHEAFRGSHLFGIRFTDGRIDVVKNVLAENNISVSVRGDAIRVSPNVYNTTEEITKFVSILNAI